ncbi:MAG: hypothetical protein KDE09_00110 [Anaerolineales bacterium]|nr:hypothetical protein [Anaerolineales bacterium]MCB0026603.1 hypothetical protein [Anaerolineales bacterium]
MLETGTVQLQFAIQSPHDDLLAIFSGQPLLTDFTATDLLDELSYLASSHLGL